MSSNDSFFRNYAINSLFFNDGPASKKIKPQNIQSEFVNSSSISTIEIDPWRQGVEITQQKHFDAGIVKVHAGEPGHELKKSHFGQGKNFRTQTFFQDIDYFNPKRYLQAQHSSSALWSDIFTYPIIVGDNDQKENYTFDGIVEIFPIREVVSFFSIEVPFQAKGIKSAIMDGNQDINLASDRVLTVHDFKPLTQQRVPYLDISDVVSGTMQINGYFIIDKIAISPFIDERLVRNVAPPELEFRAPLSMMTGSTETYIGPGKKSSTSGWTFSDATLHGTDSIVFGGQLY